MAVTDIFNAVLAFADQIGAHGYSADAPGAVKLVKALVA